MKKNVQSLRYFLFVCFAFMFSAVSARNANLSAPELSNRPAPLAFIENKGQITDQYHAQRTDIDFKLTGSGLNIFIGNGRLHYQWNKNARGSGDINGNNEKVFTESYRLDVVLLNANKNAELIASGPQDYVETYYLAGTAATASTFHKIAYKDIYPNIDWVLYVKDNQLKYDFIVHPGGNPSDIKIQYNGATSLSMKDGAIVAVTPMGSVTEQKPFTYDAVTQAEIESSFLLSEQVLSFKIEGTTSNDMVIDPLLDWSTYYGGSSYDAGIDVAADASGNVYMCGSTISSANIVTSGAHQTSFGGFEDAFLVKFNIAGTRQWATYYGGTEYDNFVDIDIDGSGNVYVAGETGSTSGIATSGAHQTAFGANFNYDIYLVKFNSSGARQWATYYGGTGHDIWASVVTDASGNVFLGGETSSTNAIASTGSHQTSMAGAQDGFLAKFNSSGVRQWGTYFGASGSDRFYNIAKDGAGNIYACGETQSTSGISTGGAHQISHAGGTWDGYLVKFTNSGSVSWATYYGGSGSDRISSVFCDAANNIYIGGTTGSSSGISTTGSHQATINNTGSTANTDGFVAKLSSAGARQWATYYGGSSNDKIQDLAIDNSNNKIYVVGHTGSANRISAGISSYQTLLNGGSDLYMASFDLNGLLEYGTYLGGNDVEYENGCGLSLSADKLYISGGTYSSAGIANGNAYQTSLAGNADGFLASFIINSTVFINQPFNDTLFCSGESFLLPYSVLGAFYPGNVFSVELSDASGSFDSPVVLGTTTSTGSGVINCTIPVNTPTGGGYRIRIAATTPAGYSGNNGKNIGIGHGPIAKPVASANATLCATETLNLSATSQTSGVFYSWSGPAGFNSEDQNPSIPSSVVAMSGDYIVTASLYACPDQKDTISVWVKPMPVAPTVSSNSPVCETTPINLSASTSTAAVTYSWSGPNSYTASQQNPAISGAALGMSGTYTVTVDLNGCTQSAGTNVTVKPMPAAPTASSNSPVCEGATLSLTGGSTTSGVSYTWSGPVSFASTAQSPSRGSVTMAMGGIYTINANLNGCVRSGSTTVVIKPTPAIPTVGSNAPVCIPDPILLSASSSTSGVSYSWTGPNTYSSSTQNPVIMPSTLAMAGSYTVTVDLNGCSRAESVNVSVGQRPANVSASQSATLCAGASINLNATSSSSGVTYDWAGPNGFNFAGPITSISNATTSMSGNYVLTASIGGCSVQRTATMQVNPAPATPTLGTNAPICETSALNLTSSSISGASYAWSGPGGFNSTLQNPAISAATPAASGVYTLTVTNSFNCSAYQTINAVVNPFPATPTAGSNSPLCVGEDIHLTGSSTTPGVSYSWSGPNSYAASQQNPDILNAALTNSGNYTLTTTLNGCSRSQTINVIVNEIPSITSVGSNTPVCINTDLKLTAQSDIPGVTYSWTGPASFTSNQQNPVINNASTTHAGVYTVVASRMTCFSAPASTVITVGINTPTPIASNNGPVCVGGDLQLAASPISGAIYTWTGPGGYTATGQSPVIGNVQTTAAGSYSVTADVNGCISLPGTTIVAVNPTSFANIVANPNDSVCIGDDVLFSSIAINPGAFPEYKWFKNGTMIPGATSSSYLASGISSGDDFIMVMSNTTDCGISHADSSNHIIMTVLPVMNPTVSISSSPDILFSEYQLVTFIATVTDAGDNPAFQWKRNGKNIEGATASTWSSTGLTQGDTISVVIRSNYLCAEPEELESNKIGIIMKTGVKELSGATTFKLFPNPNKGNFTISGYVHSLQPLDVIVQNAIGQTVYTRRITPATKSLYERIELNDMASGVYMLRVKGDGVDAAVRFTLSK